MSQEDNIQAKLKYLESAALSLGTLASDDAFAKRERALEDAWAAEQGGFDPMVRQVSFSQFIDAHVDKKKIEALRAQLAGNDANAQGK